MSSFFLISRSDSLIDDWMISCDRNRSAVIVVINGETHELKVQTDPQNIEESKLEIARNCGVNIKDLYCINLNDYCQPKDGDPFQEGGIIFELMERMENFDLGIEIARGGFGKVFLCREIISGSQFIIKKSIDNKSSLYRDIFIGSHLNATNQLVMGFKIVHDYNNGVVNLAMPFLPGGCLTSYIEHGIKQWKSLREKDVIKIAYQILTQINDMHEFKIIHCDIKPDNIVLDGDGNAKLIDFGIAKRTEEVKIQGQTTKRKASSPGTIYYLAPEIVKEETYSYKSDIWSFGMVLVEMVTGKPPFQKAGLGRVALELKKMMKFRFKPISPISKELNQLIDSCLIVDPSMRPTGEELIESHLFIDYLPMCNTD